MDKELKALMDYLLQALGEEGDRGAQAAIPEDEIPVGISNRHVHLSRADMETLFGKGYELTKLKDLSQPGQTACKETVTVVGPRGAIEKVRILGPARTQTQIEILEGDGFKLGISGKLRMSGSLEGTPGITIVGPKGSVQTREGLIVAQRHIHMLPQDAQHFGVKDGQVVDVRVNGPRGGVLSNVVIRVSYASRLECHLDTEEANAMGLTAHSTITIQKQG